MAKTWDPSSILRGRIIAVLFVMTATLAGAQALAPSVASAERVDCSNEEDREACEDGGPSGGTNDGGATDPGAPSAPGSGQSPSGGADVSSGGTNDAPTAPATDSNDTTAQPKLEALYPGYISELEFEHLIPHKLLKISDSPGDLSALTDDCQQISFTMNVLDARKDSLEQLIGVLDPGPARFHLKLRLSNNRYSRESRGTEFRALSCGAVLSLDGRD